MKTDFDRVLQEVGEFGTYQKLVVWLLCVPTCFVNAFNGFVFIFQAYTPQFYCRSAIPGSENTSTIPGNHTSQFSDHCYYDDDGNGTSECSTGYAYDQMYFQSTLITDFDLVCDRAIIWKNMLSFLNAVSIAGCFLYSYIQDRWGRKTCFMLSMAAYLFGGVASLFAGTPLMFTVLRAPWSLSGISTWNIGYIWALEYVGPSKRAYVTSVLNVLYGVATVSLALLAWFGNTWVNLGLMTTVPFFLLFSYYFFIDESPRWLLTKGERAKAARTVQKMLRWENAPPLSAEALNALLIVSDKQKTPFQTGTSGGAKCSSFVLFDLFRQHNIRWKTVLITFAWISISIVYNSIAYNVENLDGNLYWTYVLQAAVEIPANVLVLPALNRYGRLGPLFFSMLAAGLFSFAAIPAQMVAGGWAVIGAATAAKFAICLSYSCIYLLAGESYPTTLRGLGTGFSSAFGDMGTVFMPYIVHSATVYEMLPMIILGTMSVLGAFGCLFLPDTMDQYLPETVDEAEQHGIVRMETFKKNWAKFFHWKKKRACCDALSKDVDPEVVMR